MGTFKEGKAKALMNHLVIWYSVVWHDKRCLLILYSSRRRASVSGFVCESLLFCFFFISIKVPYLYHLNSMWEKYLEEWASVQIQVFEIQVFVWQYVHLYLILWVLWVFTKSFLPCIILSVVPDVVSALLV